MSSLLPLPVSPMSSTLMVRPSELPGPCSASSRAASAVATRLASGRRTCAGSSTGARIPGARQRLPAGGIGCPCQRPAFQQAARLQPAHRQHQLRRPPAAPPLPSSPSPSPAPSTAAQRRPAPPTAAHSRPPAHPPTHPYRLLELLRQVEAVQHLLHHAVVGVVAQPAAAAAAMQHGWWVVGRWALQRGRPAAAPGGAGVPAAGQGEQRAEPGGWAGGGEDECEARGGGRARTCAPRAAV
jgi:hypothetical protein